MEQLVIKFRYKVHNKTLNVKNDKSIMQPKIFSQI